MVRQSGRAGKGIGGGSNAWAFLAHLASCYRRSRSLIHRTTRLAGLTRGVIELGVDADQDIFSPQLSPIRYSARDQQESDFATMSLVDAIGN